MIAEELKQQIILKTGLTDLTPRDCGYISRGIDLALNRSISVTTLKRAFGFVKSKHQPSKYTVATLNDFVSQPLPPVKSEKVEAASFILSQGLALFELDNDAGLHPQRMVLEALDLLLKNNHESSPIVIGGKCIGIIYVKDLIHFLASDDKMYGTRYHKFNFSLRSVIELLTN